MRNTILALCMSLLAPLAASAQPANPPQTAPSRAVYATPADTIAAFKDTFAHNDIPARVDCYSPDAQASLVGLFMMMVSHTPPVTQPASPQDAEKAAFETRYGLDHRQKNPGETNAQYTQRLAKAITDKRAFLIEVMQRNNPPADPNRVYPELMDVHMEGAGETAVGKMVKHDPNGSSMSQDVRFKKINGTYLIDTVMFF